MLLCDKSKMPNKEEALRVLVDLETEEKALIISQQLLQHVGGVSTPLGIATTYHVYNKTRSKSLITLNNRLGQWISYDSLQRQLTKQSAAMMQQVEEDGVYIPDSMSHSCEGIHVFAMDNLDWTKKTLGGGSFNATTAIIIENAEQLGSADHARRDERISTPTAMMNGAFVGRRADGHHNGVSPDMLLEHTYNADDKEKSGLDGITLNVAARTKWVYTKPVTAAVSTQLKTMLHLHSSNLHYESGATRVARDSEMVVKVTAFMETNPFTTTTTHLINISTGQCADNAVKDNLIRVKELGLQALSDSISGDQQKTTVVRLKTFYTQNVSRKKPKHQLAGPGKSDEVATLLRMKQIVASGGEVDIVNFIGNHECSKTPPSLFNEDGTMRAAGTKASLVKVMREETGVRAVPSLPQQNLKTAVVVDAMYAVRRWSFHKDETFGAVARRYRNNLLTDVPTGTDSIHFCCDRYNTLSLKYLEQQHRYARSRPARQFEISEHYTVPDPQ